jgi:hypothetical protein
MTNLNSKVSDLRGLPRELPPPQDLWPGIAAQIGADNAAAEAAPAPPAERRAPGSRTLRWSMALAAGLAAVIVGVLLGRWSAPAPGGLLTDVGNRGIASSGAWLDAAFVAERDGLRSRVLAQVRAMPATQRDQLLANLVSLQRAVEEIQRALGTDPANALLQELLVGACQQEMNQLNEIQLATGGFPLANKAESRL